ncbi:MAG: hypothetical protein QM760_03770, partial [Nibricoccus sp.]
MKLKPTLLNEKPDAQLSTKVAVLHREIGPALSRGAEYTEIERMRFRDQILRRVRQDDRQSQCLGKLQEKVVCSAHADTGAAHEHGTPRRRQPGENFCDLGLQRCAVPRFSHLARIETAQLRLVDLRTLHIERNIDPHRAGTTIHRQ